MQKKITNEHAEQVALFRWAGLAAGKHLELALMYAIPNAGKRSIRAAKYMLAEGLRSGVPDICLPVSRGGYNALYLEMKSSNGRLTKNQKWWMANLERFGSMCCVVYGAENGIVIITGYLGGIFKKN